MRHALLETSSWTCSPALQASTRRFQRGTHRSVRALNADIRTWIENWNDNPRPYIWTKTADQILDSITRYCAN
jgi:hypothetical protein